MGARQSLSQSSSCNVVDVEDEGYIDDYDLPAASSKYPMNSQTPPWASSSSASSSFSPSSSFPVSSSWWRSDRGFKGFGRNNGSSTDVAATMKSEENSAFGLLGDDVLLEILSYVAIGPCEENCSHESLLGTLMDVLPLVSKRFYHLCYSSSSLWMEALVRLVLNGGGDEQSHYSVNCSNNNGVDWVVEGLLVMLGYGQARPPWSCYHNESTDRNDFMLASEVKKFIAPHRQCKQASKLSFWDEGVKSSKEKQKLVETTRRLMHQVCNSAILRICENNANPMPLHIQNEQSAERRTYLSLVRSHAVLTLPVLRAHFGPGNSSSPPNVGNSTKLRLLGEGHHRSLVEKLIKGRLESELCWGRQWMQKPRPRFLIVQDNGEGGSSALHSYVMEVLRFRKLPDNGAYVLARAVRKTVPMRVRRRTGALVDGSYDENDGIYHEYYDAQVKRFHVS